MQLVHRHVEPVGRLAALAGGVLDHEVLPGGAGDRPGHQFDVAADAVLLVHHRVARLKFERIDLVLAPGRHLAGRLVGVALAGQVGRGEHGQADRGQQEAVAQLGDAHHDHVGGQRVAGVEHRRQVGSLENLEHPVGQTRRIGDQDGVLAGPGGFGDRGDGGLGVTAPDRRLPGVDGEAGDPRSAGAAAGCDQVADGGSLGFRVLPHPGALAGGDCGGVVDVAAAER